MLSVSVLFLSGCIQGEIEEYIQGLSQVENFMENHPDADISYVLWRGDRIKENLDEIHERCQSALNYEDDHYRVIVEDRNSYLEVWILKGDKDPICFVRDTKTDEEIIEEQINKTEDSKNESLNKTKDYEEIEEDFKEEIEETKDKFEPKEIQ